MLVFANYGLYSLKGDDTILHNYYIPLNRRVKINQEGDIVNRGEHLPGKVKKIKLHYLWCRRISNELKECFSTR